VSNEDLRALYEHQARSLKRRPALGRASARARVRLVAETTTEARHGTLTTLVDLPTDDGGTGTAPHPGELMRACLGACLVLGYRVWAARLGIPLTNVEIDVICEFDTRGQLGLDDDVAVGWERILFDVRVESDAPSADVERLVAHANRLSPMLANLASSITRVHHLTLVKPTPSAPNPKTPTTQPNL
jgi:uncharacterized OsmC-like protein